MSFKHRPATQQAPLFSFVVVADTHINERDNISTSPFQTNHLANERARHVFADIAQMQPQPKFVIHLGDIVHPVPALPTFHDAVDQFKRMTDGLPFPLHVLPGNHDVGDKRVDWMPADQVNDDYLRIYREAFDKDYFSFDVDGIRFILINSVLINSGLKDEAVQKAWLEQQIGEAIGRRVFLFMHYPPYVYDTNERGSYDNLDEPGRSWLLKLMGSSNIEGSFAGHVHNFWYDKVGQAALYMLPSTAFLRHDYSEFYRVRPLEEFGRADVAKFGYFIVDVFENGHVAYSIRSMGARLAQGQALADTVVDYLAHPRTSTIDNVGVELRHDWTEVMQIPSTGGVQEFGRKWARNDYPLLALWEMGARLSKLTDLDLLEPLPRQRMTQLAEFGHRFVVTLLGAPKKALLDIDLHAAGVTCLEVNATMANFERQRAQLNAARKRVGLSVLLCKIHTYDDSHFDGKTFSHFVKSGFTLSDLETCGPMVEQAVRAGDIDGITVRIEASEPMSAAGPRLIAFAEAQQCQVLASLKLGSSGIAMENADDHALVVKLAYAMVYSRVSARVKYVFDTFMDVDRGYYPRHAFIDRQFNPRPAARAFTTLNSLLSGSGTLVLEQAGDARGAGASKALSRGLVFATDAGRYQLIDDDTAGAAEHLQTVPPQRVLLDLFAGRRWSVADWLSATARTSRPAQRGEVLLLMP